MKLLLAVFCLLLSFTQYVYSSDDCQVVLSSLVSESIDLMSEVKENLKSDDYAIRLKGLKTLKDINPDGVSIYEEILPFIQDSHPQVRLAAVQVIQQQQDFSMNAVYSLHVQLGREKDSFVLKAIDKALDVLHKRHVYQIHQVGETIKTHIRALNFSIERAQDSLRLFQLTGEQWVKIKQRALQKQAADRTVMEELAVEVHKDISSKEDSFKDMVRSLPFKTSADFFGYAQVHYVLTGQELKMQKQTLLIIKHIYSLL